MKLTYEKNKISKGYSYVIGCDEVGRGSLAGPVVAAAVIINIGHKPQNWYSDVRDSKLLTAASREELAPLIKVNSVAWGIGVVPEKMIDKLNIHNASLLAMRKAIQNLTIKHSHILENVRMSLVCVDGRFKVPQVSFTQEAIVDGDNKIFSVACASIIAKVYRDTLMKKLDIRYPHYFFAKHKGYGTKAHVSQIKAHGLSEVHRLSFCGNII